MVYRWVDASGIAHYTTQQGRIPREFRDGAHEVGRAPAQVPRAPGSVAAPPPATAPPASASSAPAPSGPRVMPEGEFEETPLGSAPTPKAQEAPAPAAGPDVAAPPPGFIRGAPGAPATSSPSAPALAPPAPSAAAAAGDQALDERISSLEEQVARDQTALEGILGEPTESRVADRTDFREIARRLPKLQADLKALREQRARQGL